MLSWMWPWNRWKDIKGKTKELQIMYELYWIVIFKKECMQPFFYAFCEPGRRDVTSCLDQHLSTCLETLKNVWPSWTEQKAKRQDHLRSHHPSWVSEGTVAPRMKTPLGSLVKFWLFLTTSQFLLQWNCSHFYWNFLELKRKSIV